MRLCFRGLWHQQSLMSRHNMYWWEAVRKFISRRNSMPASLKRWPQAVYSIASSSMYARDAARRGSPTILSAFSDRTVAFVHSSLVAPFITDNARLQLHFDEDRLATWHSPAYRAVILIDCSLSSAPLHVSQLLHGRMRTPQLCSLIDIG